MSAPNPVPPQNVVVNANAPTRQSDLALGLQSEHSNLNTLQNFLSTTLNHNGHYSVFDFSDPTKTIHVELKTRRVAHNTYPTAIVGANKVDWCDDPSKEYWFAFCYTDGIYAIKYQKALFDSFQRSQFSRGARPDANDNESTVVLIPHQNLHRVQ